MQHNNIDSSSTTSTKSVYQVNSFSDYVEFVHQLKKPPETISKEMSAAKADAIHMVLGVAGESGELVDAIKKWAIYNKDLDIKNVKEELGDLLFYITGLMELFGIQLPDVIDMNVAKLKKRYDSSKYTDADASARKDKL
jgi:NTP pyrophosphatase (non-canonical NTP hydrolase)